MLVPPELPEGEVMLPKTGLKPDLAVILIHPRYPHCCNLRAWRRSIESDVGINSATINEQLLCVSCHLDCFIRQCAGAWILNCEVCCHWSWIGWPQINLMSLARTRIVKGWEAGANGRGLTTRHSCSCRHYYAKIWKCHKFSLWKHWIRSQIIERKR